jgi:hypothetical protein
MRKTKKYKVKIKEETKRRNRKIKKKKKRRKEINRAVRRESESIRENFQLIDIL